MFSDNKIYKKYLESQTGGGIVIEEIDNIHNLYNSLLNECSNLLIEMHKIVEDDIIILNNKESSLRMKYILEKAYWGSLSLQEAQATNDNTEQNTTETTTEEPTPTEEPVQEPTTNTLNNNLIAYYNLDTQSDLIDNYAWLNWQVYNNTPILVDNELRLTWNYTISFFTDFNWISWTKRLIEKTSALNANWGYWIRVTDWTIRVTHNYWSLNDWNTGYSVTSWQNTMVTVSFDWNNIKLYINWVLQWSHPTTNPLRWQEWEVILKDYSYAYSNWTKQKFTWNITKLGFWNRALTQSEIENLYNSWNWILY